MYEIPKKRAVRRAITRDEVEAEEARADLIDTLIEAINEDPEVRAAILRLVAGARRPSGPQPARTTRRKGR